tara:strand:+ start:528 stop:1733 length:1206 start_codon:yes stop_codon:yes gene_type:complete
MSQDYGSDISYLLNYMEGPGKEHSEAEAQEYADRQANVLGTRAGRKEWNETVASAPDWWFGTDSNRDDKYVDVNQRYNPSNFHNPFKNEWGLSEDEYYEKYPIEHDTSPQAAIDESRRKREELRNQPTKTMFDNIKGNLAEGKGVFGREGGMGSGLFKGIFESKPASLGDESPERPIMSNPYGDYSSYGEHGNYATKKTAGNSAAIDPHDNDINNIVSDGKSSLLDVVKQDDTGELDANDSAEGYTPSDTNAEEVNEFQEKMKAKLAKSDPELLAPSVSNTVAKPSTTNVDIYADSASAINQTKADNLAGYFDFAPEDEYGRTADEAKADDIRLKETYGTTDSKKIKRKNRRKGFFQNPIKSLWGNLTEPGQFGKNLGKGLLDIGEQMSGDSNFEYKLFGE